jgi:anthranilate 1,2-dioxygenase small subunit
MDADLRLQYGVEQLLARYAHCLDDDRLEEWPQFFVESCLYKITSAENRRRGLPVGLFFANTRGMLQDRVSALREANIYEPQHYRHFVAQTVILEHDAAVARVQSSFQIVRIMQDGRTMLFATGCYLDRIAIAAAPFLFEERIVVCDSDRIDTLLAIPF